MEAAVVAEVVEVEVEAAVAAAVVAEVEAEAAAVVAEAVVAEAEAEAEAVGQPPRASRRRSSRSEQGSR